MKDPRIARRPRRRRAKGKRSELEKRQRFWAASLGNSINEERLSHNVFDVSQAILGSGGAKHLKWPASNTRQLLLTSR